MRRPIACAIAGVVLIGGLAACGSETHPVGSVEPRTIAVQMRTNEFDPAHVEVADGETIRFVFTNTDTIPHEAYLGDEHAQEAHESQIGTGHDMDGSESGGHDMGHDDDQVAITVDAGETGELTHTFTADENGWLIGCHEPGHYDAGMRLLINVS